MNGPKDTEVAGSFVLINAASKSAQLTIEPWGDVTQVEAGQRVKVSFRGPAPAEMDLEISEQGIVIYGWVGSILDVEFESSGEP